MIYVTLHAQRRARQRLRKPSRSALRAAKEAWEHGMRIEETRGFLRDVLDDKVLRHGKGADLRVYRGSIWIFEGQTLLTVYRVPPSLRRAAEKQERRR